MARRWPIVLLGLLLGLALGLGATKLVKTGYVADTKVFVVVAGKQDTAAMSAASTYAESQMSSYETAAMSPLVLDPVIAQLKLDMSAGELAKQVTATASTKSFVLDIEVQDTDANRAVAIANAIANQMSSAIKTLTPQDLKGAKPLQSVTITPASAEDVTSSSSLVRNMLGLGMLGLLGGIALALLLDAFAGASGRTPRRSESTVQAADDDATSS